MWSIHSVCGLVSDVERVPFSVKPQSSLDEFSPEKYQQRFAMNIPKTFSWMDQVACLKGWGVTLTTFSRCPLTETVQPKKVLPSPIPHFHIFFGMDSSESEKPLKCNRQLKANFISRLFLLWTLPILKTGAKKDLNLDDLYECLPEDSSSTLGTTVETEWRKEIRRTELQDRPPKLWRAIWNVIWVRYFLAGLGYCFDELVLRTLQPIVLQRFIKTFREDIEDPNLRRNQFIIAAALVFVTFGHVLSFQKLIWMDIHNAMKLRVGLSSLFYRKVLKLRKADNEQANVGKLVNLLSSDIGRFDDTLHLYHFLWIGPIQLTILSYLLWNELGVAGLAGVGCILIVLPVQSFARWFSTYFRVRIAHRTDERGRFINEIIGGIRLIKMYTWEKPFSSVVAGLRRKEIKYIRGHLYMRGLYVSVQGMAIKLLPFCTLIAYVLLGNTLTADKAFFGIAVFNTILYAVMSRVPNAASHLGELLVSLRRIEQFMLSKDHSDLEHRSYHNANLVQNDKEKHDSSDENSKKLMNKEIVEPSIEMNNYSASWIEAQSTLKNLKVNLKGNKLVMVIGHVGAGKSSFLNAILSELSPSTGTIKVNGRLTYASQEAWIFPATVRRNILFGLPMDKERYWQTIKLCCLSDDLAQFPDGDLTLVGERGVILSGGQKARVNLARAIYQDADIYLLDDPLSAVDPKVSKSLFNDCIKEHLNGKLRILVTHQLQYLPYADHIIVLNREGEIWSQGTYEELKNSEVDFNSLINEKYLNKPGKSEKVRDDDGTKRGNEIENPMQFRKSTSVEAKEVGDMNKNLLTGNPVTRDHSEKKDIGTVGFGIYARYLNCGGSKIVAAFIFLTFLGTHFLFNSLDYWVSLWTNWVMKEVDASQENSIPDQSFYTNMYCGLMAGLIVTTVLRSILFFRYCMKISINLHDSMFASIVRAPVRFFDRNPSGRILNRFIKDLNQIDERLPLALFDSINVVLTICGMVAINVTVNHYIALPSLILFVSLWKFRNFYLATSRDLKRIEAVAKSPIFTQVTVTFQGLTTIRALRAEARAQDQFQGIFDKHSAAFYAKFFCGRWFALWLEMMSLLFLAVAAFGFLLFTTSSQGGSVGVALSTILSLINSLQWGIRQTAELENHMTSVERAFEYCNLKQEAPLENADDAKIIENWPNEGRVQFDKVSLAYDEGKENNVLKGITFATESKEKVGIVGRTGAGKSSLITALFRLTEPDGVITIDNVPIQTIGLHTLRSRISIIPQDPVLFTGTLRYNLDPFNEFSDDQLWRVLKEVDLHHAVQSLDSPVADGGSNFSTGQRQLVCLARAILRKNRILVLDEATANVDPATDQLVQQTIRTKFSECTILTIAHRLQTVMDNDRIMVLDTGHLLEFDSPAILLENENGVLSGMKAHHEPNLPSHNL